MSNPFAAFRKNQKYWMAALVLLAIVAFVVYPALDTAKQAFSGGSPNNQVLVRWDGGSMTISDVRNAATKHASLVRFLYALGKEVVDAGGEPQVPGFAMNPQNQQIMAIGIQNNSDDITICRTRIHASYGKQIGIRFDDNTADDFIRAFCDGKVSTERVERLLSESSNGMLSWFDVRELLKEELTALVVRQLGRASTFAQPPGKTYRDFLKLNQTAKVQAFPVFTRDYLDKVTGNPTEAESQAIYEEGMGIPPSPNSPTPGFLRPFQANVQFISSSIDAFKEREKQNITEEQIRAEYDRRVELGQMEVPVDPPADADGATDGESAESAEAATGDQPATNDSNESTAAPDGDGSDPATESTEPEQGTAPVNETEKEGEPSSEDQSTRQQSSSGRFVSTWAPQQEERPPSPKVKESEEAASDAQPSQAESADSEPPVSPEAQTPDAATPDTATPDAQVPETETPGAEGTTSDAAEGPQMRTQTYEEARESILDSLAQTAAIATAEQARTKLKTEYMEPFYGRYREYMAYKNSGIEDEEQEEPEAPDLKKAAEELGLTFEETGLIGGEALAQTQFGQGQISDQVFSGSVANTVMNPNSGLELYRATESLYFDPTAFSGGAMPEFLQYVFWKTDERMAYIPDFEEVSAEVDDAWRQQKARQLAETAAGELAKKIGGTGDDPWADALDTAEKALIVDTDTFTWLTRFQDRAFPSQVPNLDGVGNDFMSKVFVTEPGQVVVAPNANQEIFYVVRVVELNPATDELQTRFNNDPVKNGPRGIANEEINNVAFDWYPHIDEKMNVQWEADLGQFN